MVPGTVVGHYRIDHEVGRGGMGAVFLAEDIARPRQVAIKVISPELVEDVVARTRFLREARTAAALDHPFICRVIEAIEQDGELFQVMELLRGAAASVASDQFALGCVLYFVATGRRAFDGGTPAEIVANTLEREPPPASVVDPALPAGFDSLVAMLLDKNPRRRLSSAADVAVALDRLRQPTKAPARISGRANPRRIGWQLTAAAAVAVAIVAVIATGAWRLVAPPAATFDLPFFRSPEQGRAVSVLPVI
jgi:serine/threonine protein kinase